MIDNEDDYFLDLISYDEAASIILPKFRATHDELRYWIKLANDNESENNLFDDTKDYLLPFASEFPIDNMYRRPLDGFFYPEYYFYDKASVLEFIPQPFLRFVYQKDLSGKRNWYDYKRGNPESLIYKTLFRANECGILRLYDHNDDEFRIYANKTQIWCHTFEGESYLNNPDSFFLLYDILNIERIFFKKDKTLCLLELGLPTTHNPNNEESENVIRFAIPRYKKET